MKSRIVALVLAFVFIFLAGLSVGVAIPPRGTIRNADIELRSGAEVAHIRFVNCTVTAGANALEVNLHDNKFTDTREVKSASK